MISNQNFSNYIISDITVIISIRFILAADAFIRRARVIVTRLMLMTLVTQLITIKGTRELIDGSNLITT